ncbi:MAG: primosomal protein N' [Oscillibacter sp.]|nr:primosomal protein N' [uncultured Oscillibacter sp.]MCI9643258.1 primosomal protein N' [Oscillibacter sp.]
MESAAVVKVAVSAAPYHIDKPYDYLVPEDLESLAVPGVRVTVPFGRGNRPSEGIILTRGEGTRARGLKAISTVLDREPILDGAGLALALWMRQRYFCTMSEAVRAILPAGLWYRLQEIWRLQAELDPETAKAAAAGIRHGPEILEALERSGGSAGLEALREAHGDEALPALRALERAGVVWHETAAKQKVGDKTRRMAELALSAEEALALTEAKRRTSPARYEVVKLLASNGKTACGEISYFTGASARTLRGMEKAGLLAFSEAEELRVSLPERVEPGPPIVLNEEQQRAFLQLCGLAGAGRASGALLQGVTGSGKTQVYLRLVQEILSQGRTAIVLVPEIVLTPQMMGKFSSYFGGDVAMFHSGLRMTERYDQWKRVRRGEVKVVLGTRSAIFAPLRNLGVIILDEEQEGSYHSENPPRYHTRDVAKYLCARDKALLVLGSATPSIETAWAAEEGQYHKALLRRRYNEQNLPQVLIADLRQEIKAGNPGLIGAELRRELERNLEAGEQSILFLNRRGSSRMLLCGECGHVPECPRCSAPLTYHSANGRLMCHHCGHSQRGFDACPACGGMMKRVGAGTQKVEEELAGLFPGAGILRMDADTTAGGHEKLLRRFERERIPILLGTQMVAKGLDFENVTLVGVLAADLSLYLEHYRAAERTFSLLTQVVGRAGRGGKSGRAVIQTYTPENDVIQCAAQQDYGRFFESEIRMRRLRRLPPFADLFTITVSGAEEGAVLRAAIAVRDTLRLRFGDSEVLGPAPAPVLKVNNRYRYRCLLTGKNDKETREEIGGLMRAFAGNGANRGFNIFAECNAAE